MSWYTDTRAFRPFIYYEVPTCCTCREVLDPRQLNWRAPPMQGLKVPHGCKIAINPDTNPAHYLCNPCRSTLLSEEGGDHD